MLAESTASVENITMPSTPKNNILFLIHNYRLLILKPNLTFQYAILWNVAHPYYFHQLHKLRRLGPLQ